MSGTARSRPSWRVGKLLERRSETTTAATLVLDVADWPGHTAGQHVSVRLSMPDGSSPVRTFSIANAPGGGTRVELTVELLMNGAVSPYLVNAIAVGSTIDVLGPIGGWFVWRPEQTEPVQLIAGGSGVVPLMAMMRTRKSAGSRAPFRLLYSARSPEAVYYKNELSTFAAEAGAPDVTLAYTREVPPDFPSPPKRIDKESIDASVFPAAQHPTAYVCGPTSFVESVSDLLAQAGYDAAKIKFERFEPSGAASGTVPSGRAQ